MNVTEKYYQKWINLIARRTTDLKIKRHIVKHAKELFDRSDEDYNNPLGWSTSMYNLIKIYESFHEVQSNTSLQLYRLLKKYYKNPRIHTPPPGNKIPKTVKVKEVKASTKK